MTRWLDPHPVNIPASFADLNLPPLIAQTLLRRGISSPVEAEAFLHPDATPSTPFPNIESAVERIWRAIHNKEMICVWGDFDVDGQTSTALLVQTFQTLGANVVYYIPVRGRESHGVHVFSLKPIIDNGAKLIVTCDTGITAHEAVDYANSRGVDVVITDHHDLGETLPNAKAIINPKQLPKDHLLSNLAGVGVAYKLAEALLDDGRWTVDGETRSTVNGLRSDNLLDLVALGLIADVALLKGETRSLAQKGIQVLRNTNRLGLKVIAELSGTNLETLTEETIGFTFAPRLNALGRLGDANPAVELLLTQDPARARVLAAQIEGLNAQRRLLTSNVYQAAEAQLRENPDLLNEPVIVLSNRGWPGGVVGIVANKLVNRYHKPAILLNESEDGIMRGSARSIEGLHITEAIATQKNILRSFGGHPMAAGMSFDADKLTEFRKGLGKAIEKQLGEVVREEPTLQIDAWLGLGEINISLAESLEMLAPFGAGNPSLTLASRNVTMKAASTIGKTKEHLRLNIEDESGNTQSILWWGGAGEELPESESKFDIAYSLRASSYRGQKQVTLQFEEFRVIRDEEKQVEIRPSKIEIRDLRLQPSTLNLKPATLIWAEGAEKSKGKSRFDLHQSDDFAIYTTPPSPVDLRKVLEIVKPRTISIFAIPPAEEKPEDYLNRLAGLCKYAINQRGGKATVHELAAAMASRESAIQIGLDWLAAGGQLSVSIEEDIISLSVVKEEKNPYLQAELFIALKGILNETSAYRKYFATVDLKTLF
ncbi:MAG: single-stranded-DNA-specific exonuclease RecJ [Anaerolineales bacterium]|nr:single-stranded-DNA-specific exonuclease RecJ [Anaerolineales bacterium]